MRYASSMRLPAARPCAGSESHRLCDGEYPTWLDCIRRQVVPALELLGRHAEAIGDSNERIAMAHGVPLGMLTRQRRGNGDDQLVSGIDRFSRGDAVGLGDLAGTRVKR